MKKFIAILIVLLVIVGTKIIVIDKKFSLNNAFQLSSEGTVSSGMCGDNLKYTIDKDGTLVIKGSGKMKRNIFSDHTEIKNVIIKKGVKDISYAAFSNCTSLQTVTLPDSIKGIGDFAFNKCAKLEAVIIPEKVNSIGEYAFNDCSSLKSVSISDKVTVIRKSTFSKCSSLEELKLPSNLKEIDEYAFYKCSGISSIDFPVTVETINENAFYKCEIKTLKIDGKISDMKEGIMNTLAEMNIEKIRYIRPYLNYQIADNGKQHDITAEIKTISANSDISSISNVTTYERHGKVDCIQHMTDKNGNMYAVLGTGEEVSLVSETTNINIKNEGFNFGAATIDNENNLYILWGFDIEEESIENAKANNTANLVLIKYDLDGKIKEKCDMPINETNAQFPFSSGNANLVIKDDIIGCFFNTKWTKSEDGRNHQGSEFAAVNRKTMSLDYFSKWEGSHSFGLTLIPTEFGFAGAQRGDANTSRAINANCYFSSGETFEGNHSVKNKNLVHASGQYGTVENRHDGNDTYLHLGGLAKSRTTYALAGKSERIYSTKDYYGESSLKTDIYDVFVKISDQTLAKSTSGLAGEDRIDTETGETADHNIVWLTECNDTEKAGLVKVVTLEDGSYCILWEKFVNDVFDSIRYVITDECGNIIQQESSINGARLSDTSIQPVVDGYKLKWASVDSGQVNFYMVNLR